MSEKTTKRSRVEVPEGHTGDRGQFYNGKGKLNQDGSPKQKPGRKQGSNVDSETGKVISPAGALRPTPMKVAPQKVDLASPVGLTFGNGGIDMSATIIEELRRNISDLTQRNTDLKKRLTQSEADHKHDCQGFLLKETELRGEIKSRKRMGSLILSIAKTVNSTIDEGEEYPEIPAFKSCRTD